MKKSPSEYYDACLTSEKQELANLLIQDGLLNDNKLKFKDYNFLDEIFIENLNVLIKKRHLLTQEQEEYINSLATKFKYI